MAGGVAGIDDYTYVSARAGIRWFPSNNFSLHVGGMLLRTHSTPDAGEPELEIEASGISAGVILQF